MSAVPRRVTIRYRRLPDHVGHFQGILREENMKRLVIEQRLRVRSPRREFGKVVVANGFSAVWFIFRRRWYDVGKFYDRNGKFTGYYCDIIRPIARLLSSASKTSIITDLFLDLWISGDGRWIVLDEDQLERAAARHFISSSLAMRARRELEVLVGSVKADRFPPKAIRRFQPTINNLRP